jgi:hypothetical protein
VRLTSSIVSRLPNQCGILRISQLYGLPLTVTGTDLILLKQLSFTPHRKHTYGPLSPVRCSYLTGNTPMGLHCLLDVSISMERDLWTSTSRYMFGPHRKLTYGPPRPTRCSYLTGNTLGPSWPVTGITLLYYSFHGGFTVIRGGCLAKYGPCRQFGSADNTAFTTGKLWRVCKNGLTVISETIHCALDLSVLKE